MTGGIFLIQSDGGLVEMREQPYDSEAVLQELLARYPDLLAGDQVDPDSPRCWLLVCREAGVPDDQDAPDRWSLDHLFLDQDAVPTLVEVKRSTDTRLRREVVGQMLDYAANAVAYWPVEAMRARFEESCRLRDADPAAEVATLLGPDADVEEFWQRVKTNLQAGRVRLVFVADEVPAELRRVVEFLNAQMDPAEVLAVEVKQFVGEGLRTLVPRVLGQTAEASRKKGGPRAAARKWDEASFFEELRRRHGEKEETAARRLLAWAREGGLRVAWGRGGKEGSFTLLLDAGGEAHPAASVWTYGRVEIPFQWMLTRRPFAAEAGRLELLGRLNRLPGVELPADAVGRRPTIPLAVLAEGTNLDGFLGVLGWYAEEVKAGS